MKKEEKKTVLILGGNRHMVNVVETANRMGFETIVTDNIAGAPAKEIADFSYNISTADVSKLMEICREHKVKGIFTAFDDVNTWYAVALCKKMRLPFYATNEQLEITSNKDRFKEYCRNFGVPVIDEYELSSQLDEEDLDKLDYPVIVKPVDSYASQGISVCYNGEDLKGGWKKAVAVSKKEKVIVERFVDNSYGVQMFYTIQNGDIVLTATADRYVHKQGEEHPPLPIAMVFPSRHQDLFLETNDRKIRNMIKGMGIENGLVFIQTLFEGGEFYVYEMGFRFSGEQHYRIVEKQTGVSLLEMMLDYSLGKSIDKYDIRQYDNGRLPQPACNLPILLDAGTIAEIRGLDQVKAMPEVVSWVINRELGDRIEITGSYAQIYGRFNIVCNSMEELNRSIGKVYAALQIISDKGKDMTLVRYLPEKVEISS